MAWAKLRACSYSLQDIVIHLDLPALQETLDHQRDVDAQAHEGAVGDCVRQAPDLLSGQGLDHPQPVLVDHPHQPVRNMVRYQAIGYISGRLRKGKKRRLAEVFQDQAAHRPPTIVLRPVNLDPVTAFTQEREIEVRQPVLHTVQVPADRPDRDLQPARQRSQLDRLVRPEERAQQRKPPPFRREHRSTRLTQSF
jgi:hypothetical protein